MDFDNFVIPAPTTGICAADAFVVASPSGATNPTLCGTNSNQHSKLLQCIDIFCTRLQTSSKASVKQI